MENESKIVNEESFIQILNSLRKRGEKLVWTNGCFDILHVGHVKYLKEAKKLGDKLIVGVNSDNSVKKLKGPERPIQTENDRAEILAALDCVDYVLIFDEDTPKKYIQKFKPDVYVKGGDYTLETINQDERKIVENYGGKISLLKHSEGRSTTKIIEKMGKKE